MKLISVKAKVRGLTTRSGLARSMCLCKQNTCSKCAAKKRDPKVG